MSTAYVIAHELSSLVRLVDDVPEDNEVKAGWTAFILVLLLVAAVTLICISLYKQLKKVDAAKAAGVYGDEPETTTVAEDDRRTTD